MLQHEHAQAFDIAQCNCLVLLATDKERTPYPMTVRAFQGSQGALELNKSMMWRGLHRGAAGVTEQPLRGPEGQYRAAIFMGIRRRRMRRIGAAAAFERRAVPTLMSEAVSSEVTAGSAEAPSRRPGALSQAMRDVRDSRVGRVQRDVTGPTITNADGSRAQHAAEDAGQP